MRRETSRVSFLMCPFCVRALVSLSTTGSAYPDRDLYQTWPATGPHTTVAGPTFDEWLNLGEREP